MNTFFFDDVQYPEGLFGGKDFFNPIIYSTEEREVGVWTDGKPLYQKTWLLSNEVLVNSNGVTISEIDASMIEHLISCNGGYQPLSNTKSIPILVWKYNNTWYYGSSIDAYVDTITLLYTKTTDVAGSAQYTTLGVPAHHYDGEEKIIGTWFGETLYEKTFSGLATNTNGDNWVNIGGIDASTWKDAVNVEIYCNSSDVNNKLTRIALGKARVFNGNVQVTTSVSYNREINVATIQYTKTS